MTKSTTVVTAYYPLARSKHSKEEYQAWYRNFFKCVTADVVCFCPSEFESEFKSLARTNHRIIVKEFNSFDMMSPSMMNVWNTFHLIDPERHIHSPELYAVWSAKQECVREAIKITSSDIYIWCDIGCFRTIRNGDFSRTSAYVMPSKITHLFIDNLYVGGGVLAGDKNAWDMFSNNYIRSLNEVPNGKDQVVYARILNPDNSVRIIANGQFGDPWFHLTSLFSSH